jgi:hypothetical protein
MFLHSGSDGSKEGPVLPPPYQEGDGLHFLGLSLTVRPQDCRFKSTKPSLSCTVTPLARKGAELPRAANSDERYAESGFGARDASNRRRELDVPPIPRIVGRQGVITSLLWTHGDGPVVVEPYHLASW